MKEEQIKVIIVVIHLDAFLTGDKGKADTEFQEKLFQFPKDGAFQILFQVAVRKPKKIEEVGITED